MGRKKNGSGRRKLSANNYDDWKRSLEAVKKGLYKAPPSSDSGAIDLSQESLLHNSDSGGIESHDSESFQIRSGGVTQREARGMKLPKASATKDQFTDKDRNLSEQWRLMPQEKKTKERMKERSIDQFSVRERHILELRNERSILESHVASLYGVHGATIQRVLKRALVKSTIPADPPPDKSQGHVTSGELTSENVAMIGDLMDEKGITFLEAAEQLFTGPPTTRETAGEKWLKGFNIAKKHKNDNTLDAERKAYLDRGKARAKKKYDSGK